MNKETVDEEDREQPPKGCSFLLTGLISVVFFPEKLKKQGKNTRIQY